MRLVITTLYLLQPAVRLCGRIRYGLAPWRRRGGAKLAFPRPHTRSVWSERWQSPDARLRRIEAEIQKTKCIVERGGDFERWDLQVRGGGLGTSRMRRAVEEHGAGKQFLRFRVWPRCSRAGLGVVFVFGALAAAAAIDGTVSGAILLGTAALLVAASMIRDCATAMGTLTPAVDHHSDEPHYSELTTAMNGSVGHAELEVATRFISRAEMNGAHLQEAPDAKEIENGNGAIGIRSRMQADGHGLDVGERKD